MGFLGVVTPGRSGQGAVTVAPEEAPNAKRLAELQDMLSALETSLAGLEALRERDAEISSEHNFA
jgi:hypothetical protein